MQARQARTTARHNRAADPLQRFLPTFLTASGRSGGSLQRVCHRIGRAAPAPRLPASTFPWRKRSTLHEPTQHAAMPDAAHSVGHRTALHSLSQDNPAFAPPYFPIWNSASLVASKARPICRKSLRAKPETTPLHPLQPVQQPEIPDSRLPQNPFPNSKFPVQIFPPVHFLTQDS